MLNGAAFAVAELRPTPLGRAHPATRLAALVLALVTVMVLPAAWLLVAAPATALALAWTGLGPGRQVAALRPWAPVAALMLVLHTFTTIAAAPLWHPSPAGLVAGLWALLRVATSVGLLGLYLRVASLDDLIAGTGWWLSPLRRLGLPVDDFGLVLAVALGTAPTVLGEGRRIAMVVRLRRQGPPGAESGRSWWSRRRERIRDRAHLVVPLLETMGRRAEALSLSLRRRRPVAHGTGAMPAVQALGLAAWLALLVGRPW